MLKASFVHFSAHGQCDVAEWEEREAIGTGLHCVRYQLRLIEEGF